MDIDDFSDEAKKIAYVEIAWFLDNAGSAIAGISEEMIGHDIWLTRNGHGSGFWDSGYDSEVEEKLVRLAKELESLDVYVGDDNEIYFMGGLEDSTFNIDEWKRNYSINIKTRDLNL